MIEYFVEDWGYDAGYVEHALDVLEQNNTSAQLSDMASELARFAKENPDCDYTAIQADILKLLNEIAEADGLVDEREEMAIQQVELALRSESSLLFAATNAVGTAASSVSAGAGMVGKTAETTLSSAKSALGSLSEKLWAKK